MSIIRIKTACPFCGKSNPVVDVEVMDYDKWRRWGEAIQEALPYLSPSQREYLMTGICDNCFPNIEREEE